jgi:hypothetical protein
MKNFGIHAVFQSTSDHPLGLALWINNQCVYDCVDTQHQINHVFEYDEHSINQHSLQIKMSGKKQLIEENNDTDTCLEIISITFDGKDVKPLMNASYTHDHNGFGESTTETLVDSMGMDGVAEFKFSTPLSYWFSAQYPF